ncbi:NnrS family protein [Maliponia aquimaris]|uniref:NnrS protein n=1 Tax=Maliponia aquimaris TaxID=1673631 RepID=A0A238L717_9RHOB|nr:NnrS family protein [Maliponia aquimaris]SMX50640.1 NnrS protein [Maliponia aquimaris]
MHLLPGLFTLSHSLWQAAHRPLFFCAALSALLAPVVWLLPDGWVTDTVHWHLHELVFGMGGAAVGGYLLTALPSWTGAGPVSPQCVRALTLLWVLARLAFLWFEILPFGLLLLLALGYFGFLALVVARQLIAARAWPRLWSVLGIAALMLGNSAVLADMRGLLDASTAPLGMVLLFATLISIIGGRSVPAFTRSWLQHTAGPQHMRDSRGLSALAITATVLGGGLAMGGQQAAAGACLLLAGILQCARMIGWHSRHTRHYPALFMLHLAWVWVPVGLILLGVAMLRPDVMPQTAALHALTMGAMGSMILAISGRAAMVRHDRKLIAGRGLAAAFALVWLAALPRVASPFTPEGVFDPITVSAAMWMLGWAVFLWAYCPALQGPVPWPVFSARVAGRDDPRRYQHPRVF